MKTGYLGAAKGHVYEGFSIEPNGIVRSSFFQKQELRNAFTPPTVIWNGKKAELYFWNWVGPRSSFNRIASDLIRHPGFVIRGKALVITGFAKWHLFRLEGGEDHARSLLAGLGFSDPARVVLKPSGRHGTHCHVYVGDDDDAFAVRMRL